MPVNTLQRQLLLKSSSRRHQSPDRLLVQVYPKVPPGHRIMIELTRTASIRLANSVRARRALKVPNPIALRWVIGWVPCGESLDINTTASLFRPARMRFSNQTQFFQVHPKTFLHRRHHPSSLVGARFHAVSLAHWGSPFLTRHPRRRGKGGIALPSPMRPPPPLSRQLLMLKYQNCPQLLVPRSRLLSRLRSLRRQA